MMNKVQLLFVVVMSGLIIIFFLFDLQHVFTLESLKQQQAMINNYWQENSALTIIIYSVIYIVVTALSLPGATILTLAGGAVFGLFWGTVIVSFVSTIGASLAFLVARFLLRDIVKTRFASKITAINKGIETEGAFYLFTLRLVPIFPFFMINVSMGLTSLKLTTFYWVSQLGMLAGTVVFVNAGTQLAKINSLSGILSPSLIASFVLLGVFPLIAKKIVTFIQVKNHESKI